MAPPEGFTKGISDAATSEELHDAVDGCWASFVSAMEAELCGVTDAWRGDLPDQRWCGRSSGVEYVRTPVLPARASREMGKVDQRGQTYLWAENRLRELAALARCARSRGPLEGARLRQWSSIIKKITAPVSAITHIRQEDIQWEALVCRLKRYVSDPASAVDFLTASANWSHALLVRRKKARELELAKSWAAFKRAQCSNGAGVLHALTKRVQDWPDVVIEVSCNATAAPQDVVDADLASWRSVWHRLAHLASTPWRTPRPTSVPPMPMRSPPTSSALRRAASTFKDKTGIGVDGVAPRHYGWLSDILLDRLGELMAALMAVGIWPRQVSTAILHLIPKAAGGRRPIGVLASFVRLWERTLQPSLQEWRLSNQRDYNWMTAGKGSSLAVWSQSVANEAARSRGLSSGAVLIDLIKAFEQVILGRVWNAAVKYEYPLDVLRLALEASSFDRRLTYRGAVSDYCSTVTAVLAGGGFASDMLLLILMGPLDDLLDEFDGLGITVIADDIKLTMHGQESDVVSGLTRASARCVEMLEEDLHMQVSRDTPTAMGKTVGVASSNRLRAMLRRTLAHLGIRVTATVKNLGVGDAAGRAKGVRAVQGKRWKQVRARKQRILALGKAAAPRVFQAGGVRSVAYGASSTGMSDEIFQGIRSLAARTFGKVAGRSVTARLLAEGADCGLTIIAEAVGDWTRAVWSKLLDASVFEDSWRLAVVEVAASSRPNAAVAGGAGAFIAALKRIGWTAPSYDTVRTRDGTVLSFGSRGDLRDGQVTADPYAVLKWAKDDYEIAAASVSQLAMDMADLSGGRGYARAKPLPPHARHPQPPPHQDPSATLDPPRARSPSPLPPTPSLASRAPTPATDVTPVSRPSTDAHVHPPHVADPPRGPI